MADNVAGVLGIEYLAATQGCDFHTGLASSATLETARALLRGEVPTLDEDRYFHPDMEAAQGLIASGRLAALAQLPGLA